LRRIGIFGGTFDPIHIGHLRSALELRQALDLDEVRFLPARLPPNRERPQVESAMRAEMVSRAIAGMDGFMLDCRELERPGPSYMVDTLADLQRELPRERLVLLLGTDAFLGLPDWHDWERLFTYAHIAVAHRPGWSLAYESSLACLFADRVVGNLRDFARTRAGEVVFVEVTQLEISATTVRELATAGADIHFLVPEVVREFIEETGCYRRD